jgi:hypothetical protein
MFQPVQVDWRMLGLCKVVIGLLLSIGGSKARVIYDSQSDLHKIANSSAACAKGDRSACVIVSAFKAQERRWGSWGTLISLSGGFTLVMGLAFVTASLTAVPQPGSA